MHNEKKDNSANLQCHPEIPMGDDMNSWIIRLMHAYGAMNFRRFQEAEVHPKQLPVMNILRSHSGISQRELAKMLHVTAPTITVTLQRLEKSGLVMRKPDDNDQRISRIYLTDKGKNLEEKIDNLVKENEEILTRGFTEQEKEMLKGMFRRMIDNLNGK